jgi:hypothetical protein
MLFTSEIIDSTCTKYKLVSASGEAINFSQALDILSDVHTSEVKEFFIDILKTCKHSAYFWECPPITSETMHSTQFQFVLIDAPRLASVEVDSNTFSSHFAENINGVMVFPSLGKDALLVAPSPDSSVAIPTYTHLANFIRGAPTHQIHSLVSTFSTQVLQRLTKIPHPKKLWLSTSGLGVYWLHVRLDSVPKYYNFHEYKSG